MKRKVIWSEQAAFDLEEIVAFAAENSALRARRIWTKLRAAASSLERVPARGRSVPELAWDTSLGFREIVIVPWRLIYREKSTRVEVWAVLDSRRDVEDILHRRLWLS